MSARVAMYRINNELFVLKQYGTRGSAFTLGYFNDSYALRIGMVEEVIRKLTNDYGYFVEAEDLRGKLDPAPDKVARLVLIGRHVVCKLSEDCPEEVKNVLRDNGFNLEIDGEGNKLYIYRTYTNGGRNLMFRVKKEISEARVLAESNRLHREQEELAQELISIAREA